MKKIIKKIVLISVVLSAVVMFSGCVFAGMNKPSFNVTIKNNTKSTDANLAKEMPTSYPYIWVAAGINGGDSKYATPLWAARDPEYENKTTETTKTIQSLLNENDIASNGGNELIFAYSTQKEMIWNSVSNSAPSFLNNSLHIVKVKGFSGKDIVITLDGDYETYIYDIYATKDSIANQAKLIGVKITIDGVEVPGSDMQIIHGNLYNK